MTLREARITVEVMRRKLNAILRVIVPQAQDAHDRFDAPLFACKKSDLDWGFVIRRFSSAYNDIVFLDGILKELENKEDINDD